jgi:caa(3)-type oxidase subunit IV
MGHDKHHDDHHHDDHDDFVAEPYKSHKNFYIAIFLVSVFLTFAQVAVLKIGLSYKLVVILLSVVAAIKAYLEAYYLMHLNQESNWLKFIAMTPFFALVFVVVAVTESIVR